MPLPASAALVGMREEFLGGPAGSDVAPRFLEVLEVDDAVEHALQAFSRFGVEPFGREIGQEFAALNPSARASDAAALASEARALSTAAS